MDTTTAEANSMKCKICQGNSRVIFSLKVQSKYPVSYFQCNNCNFIQTEDPFWIDEAYSSAISVLDTGILQRNLGLRNMVAGIIKQNLNSRGKFLDYGGGFGIFVRLMRDDGFDFYRYDKFCKNIFAIYFDIGSDLEKISIKFELITALEVFEHFLNPLLEIEKIFKLSDTIFFTTEMIPSYLADLKEWHYFYPEHGQHTSFYSPESLRIIAKKFGASFYSDGFHHILTREAIKNPFRYKNALRGKFLKYTYNRLTAKLPGFKFLQKIKYYCRQDDFKYCVEDLEYIKKIINKKNS